MYFKLSPQLIFSVVYVVHEVKHISICCMYFIIDFFSTGKWLAHTYRDRCPGHQQFLWELLSSAPLWYSVMTTYIPFSFSSCFIHVNHSCPGLKEEPLTYRFPGL